MTPPVRAAFAVVGIGLVVLTAVLVLTWRDLQAAEARAVTLAAELDASRREVDELRGRVVTLEEERGVGTLGPEDVERLFRQFVEEQGLDDLPGQVQEELDRLRDRLGLPFG